MASSGQVPQNRDDLAAHLREQLDFLSASADRFDSGQESEAKRLASTLRTLLHDTRSSNSLLGQLSLKSRKLYNTLIPDEPGNLIGHSGLTRMVFGAKGAKYSPPLDDRPSIFLRQTSFEEWWNEVIIKDGNGTTFSREDIVLSVANTDGGVHVDPHLEEEYAELSRKNSLGWASKTNDSQSPLEHPELATVRQIAHEILKTFVQGYRAPSAPESDGLIVAAAGMTRGTSAHPPSFKPYVRGKVGRNEKCPCGSSKKYKHCHGT